MDVIERDLDALVAHLRWPTEYRKRIRSTDLLERTFVEVRRRTKVIGQLPGEASALSLIWAVRELTSRGWRGVVMTPRSVAEIERLRRRQHIGAAEEVAAAEHPPRAEATPGHFHPDDGTATSRGRSIPSCAAASREKQAYRLSSRDACVGRPGGAVIDLQETLACARVKRDSQPLQPGRAKVVLSERKLRTDLTPASVGKSSQDVRAPRAGRLLGGCLRRQRDLPDLHVGHDPAVEAHVLRIPTVSSPTPG
jgi:hypothetical protein